MKHRGNRFANKGWATGGCSQRTLTAAPVAQRGTGAQGQTGTQEASYIPREHVPTGLTAGFHFGPQTLACCHPKPSASAPWLPITQGHPSAHAGHLPSPLLPPAADPCVLQRLSVPGRPQSLPSWNQSPGMFQVALSGPGLPEATSYPGQGPAGISLHTHLHALSWPLLTHQPGKPDSSL